MCLRKFCHVKDYAIHYGEIVKISHTRYIHVLLAREQSFEVKEDLHDKKNTFKFEGLIVDFCFFGMLNTKFNLQLEINLPIYN